MEVITPFSFSTMNFVIVSPKPIPLLLILFGSESFPNTLNNFLKFRFRVFEIHLSLDHDPSLPLSFSLSLPFHPPINFVHGWMNKDSKFGVGWLSKRGGHWGTKAR